MLEALQAMKLNRAVLGLSLSVAAILTNAAIARGQQDEPTNASEARQLAREAHTQDQFRDLAHYYQERLRVYREKEAAVDHHWAQCSANVWSLEAKYPRPVDSARNLSDYYHYEAAEAAALYNKYDRLASSASE